jgi:Tfp pilus assembly protein PilO
MTPRTLLDSLAIRPAWQVHATGATVVLIIAGLVYALQWRPLVAHGRHRDSLESEVATRTARVQQLSADVRRTRAQAEQAERNVRESHLNLSPHSALNARVAAVTELATSCGLQVDAIEPGAKTPGPRLTTVPVRLTTRGTAAQAMRFLAALRQRMPDTPVVAVEMTATPSAGSAAPTGPCTFDLLWFTSGNGAVASN